MSETIDKALDRVSKIKLSGGFVGRVCTVLLIACLSLGAIGALSKSEWIMGAAIAGILLLAAPLLWRIISFAEKNPGVALLDGAELLKHEQLRLASKSSPEILVIPQDQIEGKAVNASEEFAALPDVPPSLSLPGSNKKGGK